MYHKPLAYSVKDPFSHYSGKAAQEGGSRIKGGAPAPGGRVPPIFSLKFCWKSYQKMERAAIFGFVMHEHRF